VSRLLGILTRNAALKLGAVALASVLYAGLVFSQNVRVWPGPIPIEPFGQGRDVFLLDVAPQAVTSIRLFNSGPWPVARKCRSPRSWASRSFKGMIVSARDLPMASSCDQPNMISACRFQSVI